MCGLFCTPFSYWTVKVAVSRDFLGLFSPWFQHTWAPEKQAKMILLKDSFSRRYSNITLSLKASTPRSVSLRGVRLRASILATFPYFYSHIFCNSGLPDFNHNFTHLLFNCSRDFLVHNRILLDDTFYTRFFVLVKKRLVAYSPSNSVTGGQELCEGLML